MMKQKNMYSDCVVHICHKTLQNINIKMSAARKSAYRDGIPYTVSISTGISSALFRATIYLDEIRHSRTNPRVKFDVKEVTDTRKRTMKLTEWRSMPICLAANLNVFSLN